MLAWELLAGRALQFCANSELEHIAIMQEMGEYQLSLLQI